MEAVNYFQVSFLIDRKKQRKTIVRRRGRSINRIIYPIEINTINTAMMKKIGGSSVITVMDAKMFKSSITLTIRVDEVGHFAQAGR
jgi:hypothetical protein